MLTTHVWTTLRAMNRSPRPQRVASLYFLAKRDALLVSSVGTDGSASGYTPLVSRRPGRPPGHVAELLAPYRKFAAVR
jgi:hypothetical protein